MAYDRGRLRADFPEWEGPTKLLIGGLEAGVISLQELKRDIGSQAMTLFLNKFLGTNFPTTPLRDLTRKLSKLSPTLGPEPSTYESLHLLAKRRPGSFWQHSVALGRIRRGERFSWDKQLLEGLEKFGAYLSASNEFCFGAGITPLTNHARFVIFRSLNVDLPTYRLVSAADFATFEAVHSSVERLPLDPIDRHVFNFQMPSITEIDALRTDYKSLSNALSDVRAPQRLSDLLAKIAWRSSQRPHIHWVIELAPHTGVILHKAPNGFWWVVPNSEGEQK